MAAAIPAESAYILRNATVARTLLARPQSYPGDGDTVRFDIAIATARIDRIPPADSNRLLDARA